ncbi:MAG: DUF3566 domain-containing protein [Fidelibacterota bacterium]
MIYEIKKIDVWSVVKVVFVISLILYFLFGLIIFFIYYSILSMLRETLNYIGFGELYSNLTSLGLAIIFLLTIFYSVIGAAVAAVLSALGALIYNLIAGWAGGIRFNLSSKEISNGAASGGEEAKKD